MEYSVLEILAEEPVTAAMVKERLRLLPGASASEEELTIQPLITAAREYCENRAGYAFIPQRIAAYPSREELRDGAFYLPRPPVVEIESVTAFDAAGGEMTLSGASLVAGAEGPMVLETPDMGILRRVHPVAVTYTAGAEACPKLAMQAMLLLIGHWYDNREATGSATGEIAHAVDAILKHYRRWW